jgi:DNA polymerase elongation subunit (family B)
MKIFQKENKESVIDYILAEITNLFARKYDLDYFAVTKSVQDVREITREAVEKHQIPVWKKNEKNGKECWMMGGYTVKKCPDDEPDPFGFYVDKLPAVAQLALKMTKRGQLVSSGSRLGYVITTTGGVKAKQSKKIESIEYYTEHKHSLAIDYLYYLKQLATPLDQVMDIAYKTDQLVSRIFKGRIRYNAVLEELKNLYKTEFYFKE